jgi:hypothetical protein
MRGNTTNETTKTIQSTIEAGPVFGLLIRTIGHNDIHVNPDNMTDEICRYAMLHGFKQKIVDAAALSRNPDTGRSATTEDKYNAMLSVYHQLMAGDWNKRAGDGSTGAGGLLYRALCKMYTTRTPSDIKAFLDGKTKSEQAALRKNPRVAAIIEELREDDAEDGIDTESMLDSL